MAPPKAVHLDVILPMKNEYMQQIVRGEKTYEFRRYLIAPSVKRVWFYLNAPLSHVGYICEIDPARARNAGDEPLPEGGLGNREFNERHKDWDRYDYAYRVRSVWRIERPVCLVDKKTKYGIKGAPRGLVYLPSQLAHDVVWHEQQKILGTEENNEADGCVPTVKRKRKDEHEDDPLVPSRKRPGKNKII